jgi:glucosamine kinase
MQDGADYIVNSLTALGYTAGAPLCLTGGLGPHYANYLPTSYNTNLIEPKGSALDGALLLALQMEPSQ